MTLPEPCPDWHLFWVGDYLSGARCLAGQSLLTLGDSTVPARTLSYPETFVMGRSPSQWRPARGGCRLEKRGKALSQL